MSRSPVFITRKFPPSVGGMETLAAGVWRSVEAVRPDANLIAHGGSNRALPLWLPKALFSLASLIARRRVESVLTGDALMCALVAPLTWLGRVPRATMVMGLDITYSSSVYRAIVHPVLRRTSRVIAISAATGAAAEAVGVPADHVKVVRLGVQAPAVARSRVTAAGEVRALVGAPESATTVLTLGRLVRRKGVRWFVDEVMPLLPSSVHYVVAGTGPEQALIEAVADRRGLSDRIHLVGQVDDDTREILLQGADIFVQPNIPVDGDMEGFGLVTIEAAMRGTPVVAAELEGIKDAVINGRTGILLPPVQPDCWVATLTELASDPGRRTSLGTEFGHETSALYDEKSMGRELADLIGWGGRTSPA